MIVQNENWQREMSCGFIEGVGGKKANSDFLYTARFSFQIVLYSFEKVKEKSLFVLYSNCLSTCQKTQKTKTKQVVTQ